MKTHCNQKTFEFQAENIRNYCLDCGLFAILQLLQLKNAAQKSTMTF
jgi:hypothetical protein